MANPQGSYWDDVARRVAAGQEEASCEFADHFGPRLRTRFQRAGLSITDAEHLAADCVGLILEKAHTYGPQRGGSFPAWVFAVAQNALVSYIRKHPVCEELPTEAVSDRDQDPVWSAVWSSLEPDGTAVTLTAVAEGLVQLAGRDRQVLELRFYQGLLLQEIAVELGLAESTVRQRLNTALARLRSVLEADPRLKEHVARWTIQAERRVS